MAPQRVEKLLSRLEAVRESGPGRWIARCPSHEDRTPSLAIRETDDGTLLLHCFAGCGASEVMAAIGLGLSDLFPSHLKHHSPIKVNQRWIPRDVLECIAQEALVAYLAAETIQRGETLTSADMERLAVASSRLRTAARDVGCHV